MFLNVIWIQMFLKIRYQKQLKRLNNLMIKLMLKRFIMMILIKLLIWYQRIRKQLKLHLSIVVNQKNNRNQLFRSKLRKLNKLRNKIKIKKRMQSINQINLLKLKRKTLSMFKGLNLVQLPLTVEKRKLLTIRSIMLLLWLKKWR